MSYSLSVNDQGTQTLMRWNYIVVHASPMKPIIDVNGFPLSSTGRILPMVAEFNNDNRSKSKLSEYKPGWLYQVKFQMSINAVPLQTPFVSITGIQHTSNASSISVYPNPNSGKCVCTISSVESGSIRIIDSNGNEILHRMPFPPSIDSKYEIDLNDLSFRIVFRWI